MTQTANDFTKTAINENTTVSHISRNNYSYKYDAGDGRYYHSDGVSDKVILSETYPDGVKEDYLLGYAQNKKEFVDLVYCNLHPNRT